MRVQSIEAHKLERIHNEKAKIVDALRTCEQAEERKREEQAAALQRELEGSAKRREQHISELEQKLKKEVRVVSASALCLCALWPCNLSCKRLIRACQLLSPSTVQHIRMFRCAQRLSQSHLHCSR